MRRGSQVQVARRSGGANRQYRHPREMEAALIEAEERFKEFQEKIDVMSEVLQRTQQELSKRNAELENANYKTMTLVSMVQELLQHVIEKREGRRFSVAPSEEIQKLLSEPVDKFDGTAESAVDYIEDKLSAIDSLLPKFTSINPDSFGGAVAYMTGSSSFGPPPPTPPMDPPPPGLNADGIEGTSPPPLPPGNHSRRAQHLVI